MIKKMFHKKVIIQASLPLDCIWKKFLIELERFQLSMVFALQPSLAYLIPCPLIGEIAVRSEGDIRQYVPEAVDRLIPIMNMVRTLAPW